ncbi:MAG: hypothetical protein ACRC0S_00860 [Fusobacteriaceae bacterium]
MKKLLIVGTLIMSGFSFANTISGEQETNNNNLKRKIRLEQIERTTSSDRK